MRCRAGEPLPAAGRVVLVLWALVLLVLPDALRAAPAFTPSDAASPRLRIATWNMCGVRQWNCEATGSPAEKVRALERLTTVDGARVVMLQEVCAEELADAREALGEGWHSAFLPYEYQEASGRRTEVRCAGSRPGPAGIAILALSPLTHVRQVPAPQPAVGLHRGILCATVVAHALRVCDAHLSLAGSDLAHPDWEFRDDQLRSLVGAADGHTVFGGDLNGAPPRAGGANVWMWPRRLYGRYRECAQTSASSRGGAGTLLTGNKVDYLFTELPRAGCSLRSTGVSDHLALILRLGGTG